MLHRTEPQNLKTQRTSAQTAQNHTEINIHIRAQRYNNNRLTAPVNNLSPSSINKLWPDLYTSLSFLSTSYLTAAGSTVQHQYKTQLLAIYQQYLHEGLWVQSYQSTQNTPIDYYCDAVCVQAAGWDSSSLPTRVWGDVFSKRLAVRRHCWVIFTVQYSAV